MEKGKKVVCVNDVFDAEVRAIYRQLPTKNETYTIRDVSLGRGKLLVYDKQGKFIPNGASDDMESTTVRILLEELHNDLDFIQKEEARQELGFNAERFREIEEQKSTEYSEEHMLGKKAIEITTPELVPA